MRYEFGRTRTSFAGPGQDHSATEFRYALVSIFQTISGRMKRRSLFSSYRPEKHYMRGPSDKAQS